MIDQDPQNVGFLNLNVVLIGIVAIIVFGYLLSIVRKRWRKKFLHEGKEKSAPK